MAAEARVWIAFIVIAAAAADAAPAAELAAVAAAQAAPSRESTAPPREPIVGLPCEGCEAVFVGMPDSLGSAARIAPVGEKGDPLRIEGVVTDQRGRPAPGIIIYAYHTDAAGLYPPEPAPLEPAPPGSAQPGSAPPGAAPAERPRVRHGRLRGWVRTDAAGRYRFDTIRPAGYPNTGIPAHVHMHVIEPRRCTYYIDDILFDDDPRLTAEERRRPAGRGGPGIARPRRDAAGEWIVTRDIRLGERIPGYPPLP